MFEKIKQKSKEVKNWVVEHEDDIKITVYGVGMGIFGMVLATVLDKRDYDNRIKKLNKNYEDEWPVLAEKKNADWVDTYRGNTGNVTISSLSNDLIEHGGMADNVVLGAIVYTKEIK